ncbi:MAG: hypothetical protein HYY58_04665 [Candidatus Omnitrophica bacterium]|nr:hypothetical protein [Candidatus Omnitrophota bacterium]
MKHRHQRGTAMLFSLGVILVLTALGSTLLLRSLNENQLGRRSAARQGAFFLAEAGVDQALLNLRTPTDLADDVTTATFPTGTFQLDPPQSLGNLQWKVASHGFSAENPTEGYTLEAVFQLSPQSVFQFSLFGDQSVNVSGHAQTDSYDSRLGPYEDDPGPGYNQSQNGDVGTNATTAGGITVGGSIFIEGQLSVGPNVATPESVVTGYNPAFITGDPKVVSRSSSFPMTPVIVPSGLTCSDFTVTGNTTVALSPTGGPFGNGTYCYRDLTIQGNGTLTTAGSVTVYLTGQLTAQGNSIVGAPSDPKQMLILMSPTSSGTLENGTLTGSTQFYGAIYGPEATVNITGDAEIFGSVIIKQANVSGSAEIHYDKALTDQTQVSNLYQTKLVSWRED